jgi:hypothetical protein
VSAQLTAGVHDPRPVAAGGAARDLDTLAADGRQLLHDFSQVGGEAMEMAARDFTKASSIEALQ